MKLTDREQNLLFLLGMITIGIVGFKYMYIPAHTNYAQLEVQLQEKIAKEIEAKEVMAVAETIDQDIAETSLKAEELSKEFFSNDPVEYFHKWISVLAASNSLVVKNLSIMEAALSAVPVYGNTFVDTTYPIGDYYNTLLNSRGDQEEIIKGEEQPQITLREDDNVLKTDITISVSGTNTQLMNFVDHLSTRDKHIVVNSFAFSDRQSTDIQEAEVNLSVYSIDKDDENIFNGFFNEANTLVETLQREGNK